MKLAKALVVALLTLAVGAEALAAPPPWAPAHGARKKNKGGERAERYYVGWSGTEYPRDFEVAQGRCNREQVGAVLGGVVGGVLGNQVADRHGRVVATIVGAAIGALVGARVGRSLDDKDRACLGQALELGQTGRAINWTNETSGLRYELVPGDGTRETGRVCRAFTLTTVLDGRAERRNARACQPQPGVWQIG